MSASARAIARRALITTAVGALALGSLPAAAAGSVDELMDLNLRAWAGEPELLDEVYAPEAVHSATFYDRTNVYTGPAEIEAVAGFGKGIELIGPRIELPARDGEWRWAVFATMGGGSACLFHAVDGMVTRHDCVLPERSTDSRAKVGLADAAASAQIDVLAARLRDSWGAGTTVEQLAQVYAPDAVHSARFANTTRTYTGPEEIHRVTGLGADGPEAVGERVDFEAPEGELAWASVSSLPAATACLFRAVDGMVTRHDCVLSIPG